MVDLRRWRLLRTAGWLRVFGATARSQRLLETARKAHLWYHKAHVLIEGDDPDTVYAGAEDAALFRSTDGSESWQEVKTVKPSRTDSYERLCHDAGIGRGQHIVRATVDDLDRYVLQSSVTEQGKKIIVLYATRHRSDKMQIRISL